MNNRSLLNVKGLGKRFPIGRGKWLQAVDDVSFSINAGETLALVGETGCGKSTVAKLIAQLERNDEGDVVFDGKELSSMAVNKRHRFLSPKLQMIFQNPYTSLDPRMMVSDSLAEGLQVRGVGKEERLRRVADLLHTVELPPSCATRYPNEFSGGQRQRLCLARALSMEPQLLICDEITSALDVSVQAHIINLLARLQRQRNIGNLFITHNLSLVQYLADKVAVMYLGKIVESAPMEELFARPRHHYTSALLASVPVADPATGRRHPLRGLKGEALSVASNSVGCPFASRCPAVQSKCRQEAPPMVKDGKHMVRCHFPLTGKVVKT